MHITAFYDILRYEPTYFPVYLYHVGWVPFEMRPYSNDKERNLNGSSCHSSSRAQLGRLLNCSREIEPSAKG